MNLYLIVFLLLAAGSIVEWFRPEYERKLYPVFWVMVTALLCFRFGQGTDYVTYHAIYKTIPAYIDLSQGYICGFYPEIGWRLLSAFFKVLHAPFWVFTMVLGFAEMLLLHRFLHKYIPMKVAGLFLSYPVLFWVYMMSGLRQGLAMCIFLGICVPFYLEKKWIPYVVSVLAAASFHKVGYAWLVLIIAGYFPVKIMLILVGVAAAGGMVLQIPAVQQMIISLLPLYHVKQFLLEGTLSVFAVGERLFSFGLLFLLYICKSRLEKEIDYEEKQVMKAYLCGVCFYMLMFGNAYYASRYGVVFKVMECLLIVQLIQDRSRIEKISAMIFFGLALLMGIKNMNVAVGTGGYDRSGMNVLTYPYISIFNQDKINECIDYSAILDLRYQYNVEDQQLWMIEGQKD